MDYEIGIEPLTIRISQHSTNVWIVIILIVAVLAVITLVIFMIIGPTWNTTSTTPLIENIPPGPRVYNVSQAPGSSLTGRAGNITNGSFFQDKITCEANPNSYWNVDMCACNEPYWGGDCQREAYDGHYFAVGNVPTGLSSSMIANPIIAKFDTNRLSFEAADDNSLPCTKVCDGLPNCGGVIWEPSIPEPPPQSSSGLLLSSANNFNGSCTVFEGHITFREDLPVGLPTFNPDVDATLYSKDPESQAPAPPIFDQRVFLYQGQLPYRYWLEGRLYTNSGKVLQMFPNVTYTLDFIPTGSININALTGIYSLTHFEEIKGLTTDEIYSSTNPEGKFYVINPSDSLLLPASWEMAIATGQPVYVKYIKNTLYTGPTIISVYETAESNPNLFWQKVGTVSL